MRECAYVRRFLSRRPCHAPNGQRKGILFLHYLSPMHYNIALSQYLHNYITRNVFLFTEKAWIAKTVADSELD